MSTKEYILEKCFPKKEINRHWRKYITKDESTFLKETFKDEYRSDYESIFMLKHGIEKVPRCEICGDMCQFIGGRKLYKLHCGKKLCYDKLNIMHGKETCLKKYGNENYRNTEKNKATCLERYGVEYTFKDKDVIHKIKQTKLDRYGDEHYNNTEKNKATCLERYGCENVFQNEEIKQHIKEIKKNRYGDEYYTNREKFKLTCSYLYGGCGAASSNIFNKMKSTTIDKYGVSYIGQIPEAIEKRINTCLERYGVKSYTQTDAYKKHMKQPEILKKRLDKEYDTKRKNGTLGGPKSKLEEKTYLVLKEKYPDIVRQYKSNEYPFLCDFYVPDIEKYQNLLELGYHPENGGLYIECQYYPSHGSHPFDENNKNDIEYSNYLANTRFGNYDWTVRDVTKRNTAKQSNLNYLEIWNIKELDKLI